VAVVICLVGKGEVRPFSGARRGGLRWKRTQFEEKTVGLADGDAWVCSTGRWFHQSGKSDQTRGKSIADKTRNIENKTKKEEKKSAIGSR